MNISIFNILGQRIKTVIEKNLAAGYHEIKFDGSGLANGVYIYLMETPEFIQIKKMVLLK